jgi:hypothetical protein
MLNENGTPADPLQEIVVTRQPIFDHKKEVLPTTWISKTISGNTMPGRPGENHRKGLQ